MPVDVLDANTATQALVDQAIGKNLDDLYPTVVPVIALNFVTETSEDKTKKYVVKILTYRDNFANCVHVLLTINDKNEATYVRRRTDRKVADVPSFTDF